MEEPTSRLCVKNLPKHLTEKRLKDHFATKGAVTDVKILKTRCARVYEMDCLQMMARRRQAAAGGGRRQAAAAPPS
jgi:hypothetical protein